MRTAKAMGIGAVAALSARAVSAHCPLCTIGAGAAAAGAAWLGVSSGAIGVFIGALAVAIGIWSSRLLKRRFMPRQNEIIGVASFFLTVLPIMPLFSGNTSLYLSWFGGYGTLFNRTYVIPLFILGALIGAAIMFLTPSISKLISRKRGKTIPYQGIALTFLLLVVSGTVMQVVFP